MYITFDDYAKLGYSAVPKDEFPRYNVMAEALVRKVTQNRIASMKAADDASEQAKSVTEMNRRGMCEIIDIYYVGNNPKSEAAKARQVVTSFHNAKYGETYMGEARTDAGLVAPERLSISDVLAVYFTREQSYRGRD